MAAAGAIVVAATAPLTMSVVGAAEPKFYKDDPIWVERDTQDASKMKMNEVNLFVDLTSNLIMGRDTVNAGRARNTNTVDEVPNSSWFTNRAGFRALTADEVFVGPNTPETMSGPAEGAWTITSSKSDGVTPGFTIKDANGQKWFLKFDPIGYRGMATGTEVTVTKLMWALGYNVPENHIAYLNREQLVIGDGAKFTPAGGTARAMRFDDIDGLLRRANREPNGTYRVVASKALAGKPIGRVRFLDTRPDDPNDVVAHQDRRELRGYGVFAAWLNHTDAKAINSLDTLVTENGRSFVRHHIIDFGSALGSAGVGPADYWEGNSYLLEPGQIGKAMIGFGFNAAKYRTTSFFESPAVGRFPLHNSNFNADLWRPRVPNQAFLHARSDDKFWAASKLMAISTDMIRAAVRAGDFGDPKSEEFLVQALVERRDAIGRMYLTAINPISEPAIADGVLTFKNAAVEADFAKAPAGYRAEWFTFDNATGETDCIGESSDRTAELELPAGLPQTEGAFIKVTLRAIGGAHATWSKPVDAFFRLEYGNWQLVGFERIPVNTVNPVNSEAH